MTTKFLGWLLGLDETTSIEQIEPSLAAPWAQDGMFWVFFGAILLLLLSLAFYWRFQPRGSKAMRLGLGACRGLLLVLLFVTLANPVLSITSTNLRKPLLYVLFDGTESMAIVDPLPEGERRQIEQAVGWTPPEGSEAPNPSRMELVQSLLRQEQNNLLDILQDRLQCRVQAFIFDGNSTSQLRRLEFQRGSGERVDPRQLAAALATKGQVTALGAVLSDVGQQFGAGGLAGVVLVSDFAHNSGIAPLGSQANSPASRVGAPIYTVGVGATQALDLAVDLQTDPKMKRAERTNILVKLRQTGLEGQQVTVNLKARRQSGESADAAREISVGRQTVTLSSPLEAVDFPFLPEEAGQFEFIAEVDPLDGEVVQQNNRASRGINVIDDYLRLMYVAHEPTWEWRFIKEVFHRDVLVGMQGFRTYLASSDPRVRESNALFLATLTPKRSEFFKNDVIFLGDMPQASITSRFAESVKEYVGKLGGGLVVIAGPRFGPRQLHNSPIADMLPVIIDPDARMIDREFRSRLTAHADRYSFMRLGDNEIENRQAWDNLGALPWYQPVTAVHEQASVLAEHPTEFCADGKTRQPLIAIRPYGNGEVVYLAFNEMWRLRRKFGERYYRQFWSQLIYRLGMSHALGDDKRFVARLDRRQFRVEDKVTLTVEAYDENYEPLGNDEATRSLSAEFIIPGKPNAAPQTRQLTIPLLREGVYEARIPVYTPGQYSLRVKDPITGEFQERSFEVSGLSAERRRGVRDLRLQEDLARDTSGRSYDLLTVSRLAQDLRVQPLLDRLTRNYALWTTPLWFVLVVGMMLGEWFTRKMINLT